MKDSSFIIRTIVKGKKGVQSIEIIDAKVNLKKEVEV